MAQLRLQTVALRMGEMLAATEALARLVAEDAGAREENGCAEEPAPLPEQAQHLQAVVLRLKARNQGTKRARQAGAKQLEKRGRVY